MLRRVEAGKALQALLLNPEGRKKGGPLIDPDSVAVRWNGEELPVYVHYKRPDIALVFALPVPEVFQETSTGTLTLAWRELGGATVYTSEGLQFRPESLPGKSAKDGTVRVLRVEGPKGNPVAFPYYFGQRSQDLFARGSQEGRIVLDAPNRNTPGEHYAWARDYWTTAFDPISSPTVTLLPRKPETTRKATLRIEDQEGGEIIPSLVIREDSDAYVYTGEGEVTVARGQPTIFFAVAAGYAPKRIEFKPGEEEATAVMRPLGGN